MANKKYLGIDFGDKNIGLALGELGSIAVPYKILANISQENTKVELEKIIKSEQIDGLVIGLPTSLSGQANERSSVTNNFIKFCQKNISVPVYVVDESFTSQLYVKQGIKKDLDKYSAAAILETFLTQNESKL
ncbi:MAG: Holliday junction resolvase RuvX [Patescibacteria group bacterium]|jgi:putative Holliday junction resolvase